jgi:hypothetical protein
MLISYAICVSTETTEIMHLLTFLKETRHPDSEIVVLVDTSKDFPIGILRDVKVVTREFDRDFAAHKNFLNMHCSGDYIFNIDADEIPMERLMNTVTEIATKGKAELVYVPRINICPGYTEKFAQEQKFSINEAGWINWPDYQGRIYRRGLLWKGAVHEKIDSPTQVALEAHPQNALWHIKSVTKQVKQNKLYTKINGEDSGTENRNG